MRRSYRSRSGSISSDQNGNSFIKPPPFSEVNGSLSSLPGAAEAATFLFQVAINLHSAEYEVDSPGDDTSSNKTNFLHTLMRHRGSQPSQEDICLIDLFLQRASYLDICNGYESKGSGKQLGNTPPSSLLIQTLLSQDRESGYSPLHEACMGKKFLAILVMLRHAALRTLEPYPPSLNDMVHFFQPTSSSPRCPLIHPMKILDPSSHTTPINQARTNPSSINPLFGPNQGADRILWNMVTLKDKEGLSPLQLLCQSFASDFNKCRLSLSTWFDTKMRLRDDNAFGLREMDHDQTDQDTPLNRPRAPSFSFRTQELGHDDIDSSSANSSRSCHEQEYTYGCEIMTFGKADHCALGVPQCSNSERSKIERDSITSSSCGFNALTPTSVRPKRVDYFALGPMGRDFSFKDRPLEGDRCSGSAVAVAAATHHSLVVTSKGHLYAFGLGKGGRLGTGNENHCPLPVRILGALEKRQVVAVSAAENHSLCVTSDGSVFAWGQNGFGQLGIPKTASSSASSEQKFLPQRVEALRQSFMVMVAAGDRHSMALSRNGEVYTWGENKNGQLGLGSSSETRNVINLPTLVSALLSHGNQRRVAFSIAASEFSSLVLTRAQTMGLEANNKLSKINSVFEFGHGNYNPTLVVFPSYDESIRPCGDIRRSYIASMKTNPVAIACAKYHNVAVTDDGRVYTWGLHSSELGTSSAPKPRQSSISCEAEWIESNHKVRGLRRVTSAAGTLSVASPQLVQGMLPEYGGGRAVQVSASENHTCVITDCGTLYTWGTAYGNDVLGHQGVKYQPTPLKVPGVHRAVTLASAKEHTILLLCTKFPTLSIPDGKYTVIPKLQDLAAKKMAAYVDLFNVVPVLHFAERMKCSFLIDFCNNFISYNLDGILSVGRKSEFEAYLNETLSQPITRINDHDEVIHPLIFSIVKMKGHWMNDCRTLMESLPDSILQKNYLSILKWNDRSCTQIISPKTQMCSIQATERARKIAASADSDNCTNLESAQSTLDSLSKEVRTIKKKIAQVSELMSIEKSSLMPEQVAKVNRRPFLEADLKLLEPILLGLISKVSLLKNLKVRDEVLDQTLELMNESIESGLHNQLNHVGSTPVVKVDKDYSSLKSHGSSENALSTHLIAALVIEDHCSPSQSLKSPKYTCKICNLSCPDEKSYELHINGRKHFNNLRHIQEKNERDSLAKTTTSKDLPVNNNVTHVCPDPDKLPSPWVKTAGNLTTPRYNLPQPFQGLSESSEPSSAEKFENVRNTPKKTFQQIMDEEERSTKKKISPSATTFVDIKRPVHLGGARTMSTTPSICTTTPSSKLVTASPSHATSVWNKNATSSALENMSDRSEKKSMYDIQQDEINRKALCDKGVIEGKWYVDHRERALSISAIQQEEAEAHRLQLFIEEQRAIEEQIMKARYVDTSKDVKNGKTRHSKEEKRKQNSGEQSNKSGRRSKDVR